MTSRQFAAGDSFRNGPRRNNNNRRYHGQGGNGGHRFNSGRDEYRYYETKFGNHQRLPNQQRRNDIGSTQAHEGWCAGGTGMTFDGNQHWSPTAEHQQRHYRPSSSARVGHHSHKRGSPHNENSGPQKKPRGLSVNRDDHWAIDPEKLDHECPALVYREKWEGKKRSAANEAIKLAIGKDMKSTDDSDDFHSDSSDCSRGKVVGKQPSQKQHWLDKLTEPLVEWSDVHLGGFFVKGSIAEADKCCRCFCQDNIKEWRKNKNIDIDVQYICKPNNNVMDPRGLMDHLKERKDVVHFAVLKFMEELFKDYYLKGCNHEALYKDQKFGFTRKMAYEESIKQKMKEELEESKERNQKLIKTIEYLKGQLNKLTEQEDKKPAVVLQQSATEE